VGSLLPTSLLKIIFLADYRNNILLSKSTWFITSGDNHMTKKTHQSSIHIPCTYGISVKDMKMWFERLLQVNNRRPICAITAWTYWDIEYQQEEIDELAKNGFLPSAIFSENIIWDEQNRWPTGFCVKSTWLQNFEHDCVFHTKNTSYLLVGAGKRRSISPYEFNAIHF
jgi:hypothetical protein